MNRFWYPWNFSSRLQYEDNCNTKAAVERIFFILRDVSWIHTCCCLLVVCLVRRPNSTTCYTNYVYLLLGGTCSQYLSAHPRVSEYRGSYVLFNYLMLCRVLPSLSPLSQCQNKDRQTERLFWWVFFFPFCPAWSVWLRQARAAGFFWLLQKSCVFSVIQVGFFRTGSKTNLSPYFSILHRLFCVFPA